MRLINNQRKRIIRSKIQTRHTPNLLHAKLATTVLCGSEENELHQDTPKQSQDDIKSQLAHRFRKNNNHDMVIDNLWNPLNSNSNSKRRVHCNDATIRYQTIDMIDLSILRNAKLEDPAAH